ncbi:MAG: acyl--CoA ligase, partial [Actinobacteria bacterium]|nr:acyl--CoA ligase [Actinomycetota bacterium]NIY13024.1 AMP-binding protein [Gemmatimonadota bacterium]NIS35003.1 acyl--CoA ligase [Actinomycetota bacterium]NIT99113.1 acyl--CoA ligase [Actinomycetota bacterium]NIU22722.1 acyl--CoA ligase [Actinomycetota bacterium]
EPDGRTARRYDFAEIAARCHRAAHLLRAAGVEKGDRVFVQLPRVVEWYEALAGCIELGAIPMPGTTQLMPKDIGYRIGVAD